MHNSEGLGSGAGLEMNCGCSHGNTGSLSLLAQLRQFERKERFAVLREALGFDPDSVDLDEKFRRKLSKSIGMKVPTTRVFLAMDYHLDWIEVALHIHNGKSTVLSPFPFERASAINSNQQDIDLLIAFDDPDDLENAKTHLILIEAKAYSSWNQEQLDSKASRLRQIFDEDGGKYDSVHAWFILLSGRKITSISTNKWPEFMKCGDTFRVVNYDLPERLKITRCDNDGKNNARGPLLRLDKQH